ncbi:unnamed protein product [Acanthoscelides obtectus]|uniref:FGFR1 oncogene partner (FOP) N-terminal dimerisation domain-containing protein n=1 Tax=Acanthoscelides obtectus TaxID=200917 RepID=A0A9P0LEQ6_ACAOB|nr:unnamed protein product [Acanthoscelides obtectus]CAK1640440.1 FGFR1 oncogene partner [Acanthoscelides obtectus]
MSVEEEVEFRDLISQTLEANGCLASIRAQLRASIVLALDEDPQISCRQPMLNNQVKQFLDTADGHVMFSIVHEFLEFFNLYSTLSVYHAEGYFHDNGYKGRQKLVEDLGLPIKDESKPILFHLLKIAQVHLTGDILNSNVSNSTSIHTGRDKSTSESSLEVAKDCSEVGVINEQNGNLNATYCINKLRLSTEDSRINKSESLTNGYSSLEEVDEEVSMSDAAIVINHNKTAEEELVKAIEKQKLTQKSDKMKSKSSLSSLSDLPPLQLNRSRGDMLPSLYSKELKERSNLKELDKLFDVETEYEEDFTWNGASLSSDFKPLHSCKDVREVPINNDSSTSNLKPGSIDFKSTLAPASHREPDPPDLTKLKEDQTVGCSSKEH